MWEFWSFIRGVRINRVEDSIAMMESIMVGVGGAKGITEGWQKILEDDEVPKEEKPIVRTKESIMAAKLNLAALFQSHA